MDPWQTLDSFPEVYPSQPDFDVYPFSSSQVYTDADFSSYVSLGEYSQTDVATGHLDTDIYYGVPHMRQPWLPPAVSTPPATLVHRQQQQQQQEYMHTPGLVLQSSVPVSGTSWPVVSAEVSTLPWQPYERGRSLESKATATVCEPDVLQMYANAPRETFPTPSELLSRAAGKQKRSVTASAKYGRKPEKKVETQRKALQRVLEENVSFLPTDPDTISSHDKKRYYLECLEHYITYLHEQLRLVGHEPVALERVSTYRGLNSRSIRTVLVHAQDVVRKTHDETMREEETFLRLRDQAFNPELELESHRSTALSGRHQGFVQSKPLV
ncbi:hypothetical protein BC834DRAFT_2977 [Gloeopeniophorella convolvens]|nr:hypothetical protein BC834DRAFT_2977 [Gloeopeniophorella convolvens]